MASSETPVMFFCTCKNAFYFYVNETDADLEDDAFTISVQCFKQWLQSKDQRFLLLNDAEQFQAQHLTKQQKAQPECKFSIHFYNNTEKREGMPGRAVMLYANKEGKKFVVCCNKENKIYPEVMDLPSQIEIEDSAHKALFYLRQLSASDKFMLESTVYPQKYLGFERDLDTPGLSKLVLRVKSSDEVDEVILSE